MQQSISTSTKMSSIIFFTFVLAFLLVFVNGQNVIVTPTGDSFVCVPAGSCNNGGRPPTPGIDPRIVTPGQATGECPAGQVACYTQGPNSICGQRLVTPAPSTQDGTAPVGANPWQAYITNATLSGYAGSGVLIDNYHVLTAAHKISLGGGRNNAPGQVTVRMGVTNPADMTNTQVRTAVGIRVHENFDSNTLRNDIAIIRVNPPFSLSQTNINTLCLPASGSAATSFGQPCIVAGWGETSFRVNDQPTNPMKQVNLNIVDYNTCRNGFLPTLPNVDTFLDQTGEICAGGQPMRDACTYDGGAPLTCPSTGRGTAVGLVIWGKSCGQPNVAGVYVNLANYRTWINQQIQMPTW